MKKYIATLLSLMAFAPAFASAHEHASYHINGKQYDIVIGSLNEPVVVDDKTGLDLRVTSGGKMKKAEDGDMEPVGGTPALGLENSLKVEMMAGATKKTFDLSPVFGMPGAYKTTFYPTVATTFSYRLFGTLDGTPVDLTFACLPDGQEAADEGEKDIAPGVKQLMKGGGFGCPLAKESLGFPEDSKSIASLGSKSASRNALQWSAIGLALAALALSIVRRR